MTKKIGFIGVGNMGTAIIKGLSSHDEYQVHGTDSRTAHLTELSHKYGLVVQETAADLVHVCDYIVISVKPQHAEAIIKEIASTLKSTQCLISICAGLNQSTFKAWTDNRCPVVRVMPNTPALVLEGVSAICLDDTDLTDEMKRTVPALFDAIGQAHVLPETQFDAFTGLIGSGPAYVFYFMEAMIESGVALGLNRDQTSEMVKGLFLGASKLAHESNLSVSQLREMVSSPGGTTLRALMHFDRKAVRGNIIDGVFESYLQSIKIGK